jgi:hypothetical protein
MTEACPGHWLVKASELRVCIVNGLIAFLTMQKTCFFFTWRLVRDARSTCGPPSDLFSDPRKLRFSIVTLESSPMPFLKPPPLVSENIHRPTHQAAPPAAFLISSSSNLFQLPNAPTKVETPYAAVVIANTAFNPTIYASSTTGTCALVNTSRICVAPTVSTIAGSIPGKFLTI